MTAYRWVQKVVALVELFNNCVVSEWSLPGIPIGEKLEHQSPEDGPLSGEFHAHQKTSPTSWLQSGVLLHPFRESPLGDHVSKPCVFGP